MSFQKHVEPIDRLIWACLLSFLVLWLSFAPLRAQEMVRSAATASVGTAAPSGGDCDAAGEVGRRYVQGGAAASVPAITWVCMQTDTSSYAWKPDSVNFGSSDPAKCTVGMLFYNTTTPALKGCSATDTWTTVGGSSYTSIAPQCLPSNICAQTGAIGPAYTSKIGHYYQFEVAVAKTITSIGVYANTGAGTCGTACGVAISIYTGDCATKLGSITTTVAMTTGIRFNLAMASSLALTPGSYILGVGTDGAALKLYGAGDTTHLTDSASTKRTFTTTDALTGDNGTLAMPAACTGTRTAITSTDVAEGFALLP